MMAGLSLSPLVATMTDFPPEQVPFAALPEPERAAVRTPPETACDGASATEPGPQAPLRDKADAGAQSKNPPGRRRRGQRTGRSPTASEPPQTAPRASRTTPAVLEQLAELYPGLFGAVFLPLKRGIFQDLVQAHPDVLDREALKAGLAIHTRSTRYLQSVAAGLQRHDLSGQAVEAMAPEHVHHALLEVFRRRQGRLDEDLRPKLLQRLIQAFEASGLSREAYEERVRGRDEAANALLDEAMAEAAARRAKDEALLRAFEGSGQPVQAFAAMYGMDPHVAARTLERARQRRAPALS
jgi:ProP effector